MNSKQFGRTTSTASVAVVMALAVLSGCSGGSDGDDADAPQSTELVDAPETGDAQDNTDDNGGESDGTTLGDQPPRAVEVARSGLSSPVEVALAEGGTMVAGIECGPDGAHVLIVGASGLTPGDQHDAEIEPNQGSALFFVQDNGDGYSGHQSRFDAASYTLTWPNIDGGLSVTVEGCPA